MPGVNRMLKLSSNEGAFGVPPGAQAAYREAADELHRYPDGGATELRRGDRRAVRLDPGADRLRRRLGRPDLPALPGLWRAGHATSS